MAYMLERPPTAFDPAAGLLRAEHFQMAYLVSDMDAAQALLGERLGICGFRDMEGPMPGGGHMRAALAWVGTLMYELMEVSGSDLPIYTGWLPPGDGLVMRHHHLGYLVRDRAAFDHLPAAAARAGGRVVHKGSNPLVDSAFVEVPALGHYLEYLLPTPAGLDFFDAVPRS